MAQFVQLHLHSLYSFPGIVPVGGAEACRPTSRSEHTARRSGSGRSESFGRPHGPPAIVGFGAGPRVSELVEAAAEQHSTAVALTDFCCLAGAVEFSEYCERSGIRPIIGADLLIAGASSASGEESGGEAFDSSGTLAAGARLWRLPVLVQNAEGYRNLLSLLWEARLTVDRRQATPLAVLSLSELASRSAGLVILSGFLRQRDQDARAQRSYEHGCRNRASV